MKNVEVEILRYSYFVCSIVRMFKILKVPAGVNDVVFEAGAGNMGLRWGSLIISCSRLKYPLRTDTANMKQLYFLL